MSLHMNQPSPSISNLTEGLSIDLTIDTTKLLLMPKELWGTQCSVCDKPQSRWGLVVPLVGTPEVATNVDASAADAMANMDMAPICSMCFLYESRWAQRRAEALHKYFNEDIQGLKSVRAVILDPKGRLTNIADADFFLGIIAFASKTKNQLAGKTI